MHRKLLAAAQATAEDGYVYLAEMGRKEMEDDLFGVRHLPLQRDNLPSFGNLPVVVVQGDRELMILAHRTYPEAHVYLFEASPQFDTFTDLIAFSARLRAAA